MAVSDNKRSRWLRTAAFVVWLCVVWGHSLMSGDASSAESSRFVFLVRPLFELFGCHDEAVMTFAIRKCAHFSEYAILAGLGLRMAQAWCATSRGTWLVAGAIWVVVPVLDELLQTVVPGRSGNPRDVLIDMAGGAFGMLVVSCWERMARRRRL